MMLKNKMLGFGYSEDEFKKITGTYILARYSNFEIGYNFDDVNKYLEEFGFNHDEIIKIGRRYPAIYSISVGNIERKII